MITREQEINQTEMGFDCIAWFYLEGDCESRYGEVATLTQQICPRNCYRQILGTEIVIVFLHSLVYTNLYVSVHELNGQVCFLDKAVDGPDIKSNIAQRNCAVHRKLNAIQGQI